MKKVKKPLFSHTESYINVFRVCISEIFGGASEKGWNMLDGLIDCRTGLETALFFATRGVLLRSGRKEKENKKKENEMKR